MLTVEVMKKEKTATWPVHARGFGLQGKGVLGHHGKRLNNVQWPRGKVVHSRSENARLYH